MRKMSVLALLALVGLTTQGLLAGSVRSGPQPGDKVPGPFRPLHVTGPDAGQRVCLYCKFGSRPVAVVFAREITPAVAQLLAKIDVTAARPGSRLGSFAVFLGEPGKLTEPVKQLANNAGIRQSVLAVDEAAPKSYAIAADAAVTVIIYNHLKVSANHAFRAGELDSKASDAILADLNRMLQAK
jgi:hypothetical protein